MLGNGEITTIEMPVKFEQNGKIYVYDFNVLTAEQCELAREVGEFRINSENHAPVNFVDYKKSGAMEWLFLIMAFLLREEKAGTIQPFAMNKAENETFVFAKNIVGYDNNRKMRECVRDFFTNIGLSSTGSQLLSEKKNQSETEMLFNNLLSSMKPSKPED